MNTKKYFHFIDMFCKDLMNTYKTMSICVAHLDPISNYLEHIFISHNQEDITNLKNFIIHNFLKALIKFHQVINDHYQKIVLEVQHILTLHIINLRRV